MGNATQGMHARSRARACRDGSNEDYGGNAKRARANGSRGAREGARCWQREDGSRQGRNEASWYGRSVTWSRALGGGSAYELWQDSARL
jgi:hypothetical protein